MNDPIATVGPFERRRSNRAILIVVAMALAGTALNDGVHSLMAHAGEPGHQVHRLASGADQKARAAVHRIAGSRLDHCHDSASGHDSVRR